MGTIAVQGSIVASADSCGGCGGTQTSIELRPSSCPKPSSASVTSKRVISSPGSYVALTGIGAGGDVSKCDFLYVHASGPIFLRVTQKDPGGGSDVVSVLNVQGMFAQEFPSNGYATLVEVKGSATVEYLASGTA